MSIKNSITQEDYTAFVRQVSRMVSAIQGDKFVRILIGIGIGFGFGFVLSLMHLTSRPTILAALLCGALAGIFLLLMFLGDVSRRQMQKMRPVEGGYIIGSQEVFLEDEGIRQTSSYHQSIFRWSLVRAIVVTEDHVFVMVDRIAGIILPMRAFSSDSEREQFISEIEKRSGKLRS